MPKVFTPEQIESIAAKVKEGKTDKQSAEELGISISAYKRWSKRLAKGIKQEAKANGHNGHAVNGHGATGRASFIKLIDDRLQSDREFLTGVVQLLLK